MRCKESLEMAKRAKTALIATHDMSATKKIFELNHGGKTRLAEIPETVSCNCCFARGSDLRLRVIWVLMNLLQVNKHDRMLHQKAHSAENVLKLFSNCQPNNVVLDYGGSSRLVETWLRTSG